MEVLMRYKRKAVPNPLEIRGVSQSALESLAQPLPDELPLGSLPKDFTENVEDAISAYSPEPLKSTHVTRRAAPTAQPAALDETHSLSLSDTWTTGGAGASSTERMTDDRSSTSSALSYDDFDHEASVKVRLLFEEIDAVLFENDLADNEGGRGLNTSDHIYTECHQWSAVFPHLRILGKQLVDSKDMGYQCVSSPAACSPALVNESPSSGNRLEDVTDQDLHDLQTLSIEGRRAVPKTLDKCCLSGSSLDTIRHLEEEIFVQDGSYEEVIAIDHDAQDDGVGNRKLQAVHRRHRSRYPPVTPNACVKDDVCNAVFDIIWSSANGAMRVLLQQYADSFVVPSLQQRRGAVPGGRGRDNQGKPLAGGVANDGTFRFPQIVSVPPSRSDYAPMANRPLGSLFSGSGTVVRHPHLAGSVNVAGGHAASAPATVLETIKLDNILTISKKEMQTREKTFSEEPSASGTPTASMSWPGGSSLLKKAVGTTGLHRNMSATMKKTAAAGTGASRGRLAPLNDRVRTPNVEEDYPVRASGYGLQGLHMAGKRISSPPAAAPSAAVRTLPPIVQSEHLDAVATASMMQRMQKRGSRATSAAADKEGRLPRTGVAVVPDTRPSTTHTAFRADTPNNTATLGNRQSSTPIAMTMHHRGDSTNVLLGITGSGLTGGLARENSDAALLSSAALVDHLRQRTDYADADLDGDDDDEEHYDDFAHHHYHPQHQYWGSPHAAVAGYRLRGGKTTLSSFAR